MNHSTSTQTVLFDDLAEKPVVASFDQEYSSSDGGAVLLKAADQRLGLSEALAACLVDNRQQSKVSFLPGTVCAANVWDRVWLR